MNATERKIEKLAAMACKSRNPNIHERCIALKQLAKACKKDAADELEALRKFVAALHRAS